jgi:glycosyltransferase involved in cell wall biosynthesis
MRGGEGMKVMHLAGWYFPESIGGTEVYVAGLCHRLRASGYDVSIACPKPGIERPERYLHDGIEVFRFPVPETLTRDEAQGRVAVDGSQFLHRELEMQKPDIVHFHTLFAGLGVAEIQAARNAGARVVVTNHLPSLGYTCQRGTLMRWGESLCDGICEPVKCAECELQNRGMGRTSARLLARAGALIDRVPGDRFLGSVATALLMTQLIRNNQALQRSMFDLIDRFVVLNKWSFDTLVANGAPIEKLVLNYLGYSQAEPRRKPEVQLQPTTPPVLIGYVGRLVAVKGVIELLKAIESLPPSLPLRFELRGTVNDAESAGIASRITALARVRPNVTLGPPVSPAEVPGLIASFDILCVPSTWFENGPTVVSEAHAVGTPVIGSSIGAMAEIITSGLNGRLVPPGDWRALAESFVEVAANPAATVDHWRANLGKARTMDQIALDYEALYHDVLAAASGACA